MADQTYHPDAIHHPPSANFNEGDLLNGTGAPGVDTGKNGDLYLDLSTGDVYQKSNGVWVAIGGGGGGVTCGNYAGAEPSFTPSSACGNAIDTSNERIWWYYSGAWH